MSEQFFNHDIVHSGLHQPRSERVPEIMEGHICTLPVHRRGSSGARVFGFSLDCQ
jgi:hypothetical protein